MLLGESLFLGGEAAESVLRTYSGKFLNGGSLVDGNVHMSLPTRLNNGYWLWPVAVTNANFDGGGEAFLHRFTFAQTSETEVDFSAPQHSGAQGNYYPGTGGNYMMVWGAFASYYLTSLNFNGTSFSSAALGFVYGYDFNYSWDKIIVGQGSDGHLLYLENGSGGPQSGVSKVNPDTATVVERWGVQRPGATFSKSQDGAKWLCRNGGHQYMEYNSDMKGGLYAEFSWGVQGTTVTAGSSAYNVYAGNTNGDGYSNQPCFFVAPRGVMTPFRQIVLNWSGITWGIVRQCLPSPTNPNHFFFVATGGSTAGGVDSSTVMLIGCIDVQTEQLVWRRQLTSNANNPQFTLQGFKLIENQLRICFRDAIALGNRFQSRVLDVPSDNTFPIISMPGKLNISTGTVSITTTSVIPQSVQSISVTSANYQTSGTNSAQSFPATTANRLSFTGLDTL